MMGNLGSLLGFHVLQKAGETIQKRAAKFAYEVFRKAAQTQASKSKKIPDWKDLTERQQDTWIVAAGDVLDQETKR